MAFIERLTNLMTEKKITSYRLSKDIGISNSLINKWQKNPDIEPSAKTLQKISEYFQLPMEWFLVEDGNTMPVKPKINDRLSNDEIELISNYKLLDDKGKGRLLERSKGLLELMREGKEKELKEKQAKQPKRAKAQTSAKRVVELFGHEDLQSADAEFAPELVPDVPEPEEKELTYIKVYSIPASAGSGSMMFDDETPYDERGFDPDVVPAGADYGIRIRGDSMEPIIHEDDIVFVKDQRYLDNGNIGIIIINGESFCKRYNEETGIYESLNPAYPDINLRESDEWHVAGKVLLTTSFFRR